MWVNTKAGLTSLVGFSPTGLWGETLPLAIEEDENGVEGKDTSVSLGDATGVFSLGLFRIRRCFMESFRRKRYLAGALKNIPRKRWLVT
jgi:hypothetical protein